MAQEQMSGDSDAETFGSSEEAQMLIKSLREEKLKAEEEVKSIRVKLHGAVRKGKATENARLDLEKQLESLRSHSTQNMATELDTKV